MEAQEYLNGALGARSRRRLEASPDFEEVLLLAECDRDGRRVGVPAPELDEALAYLRELSRSCESGPPW